jgi:DNA-binding transcriptional LysR family regulator
VAEPFNAQGFAMQSVFVEELVLITPKSFGRIRSPKDIGRRTVIAFATGCSYRRRLESWLATANVLPDRVMEFQSYHAIVACVAAGSGIAVIPRSVLAMTRGAREVIVNPLPHLATGTSFGRIGGAAEAPGQQAGEESCLAG